MSVWRDDLGIRPRWLWALLALAVVGFCALVWWAVREDARRRADCRRSGGVWEKDLTDCYTVCTHFDVNSICRAYGTRCNEHCARRGGIR